MKINNKMTSEQIFKNLKLKEHTLYRVIVKSTKENVDHYAFLFIGFKSGSYCEVYSNNYDAPIPMNRMYSIVIDKKLSKIKYFKFKTKK
jgi:predicted secreted protein